MSLTDHIINYWLSPCLAIPVILGYDIWSSPSQHRRLSAPPPREQEKLSTRSEFGEPYNICAATVPPSGSSNCDVETSSGNKNCGVSSCSNNYNYDVMSSSSNYIINFDVMPSSCNNNCDVESSSSSNCCNKLNNEFDDSDEEPGNFIPSLNNSNCSLSTKFYSPAGGQRCNYNQGQQVSYSPNHVPLTHNLKNQTPSNQNSSHSNRSSPNYPCYPKRPQSGGQKRLACAGYGPGSGPAGEFGNGGGVPIGQCGGLSSQAGPYSGGRAPAGQFGGGPIRQHGSGGNDVSAGHFVGGGPIGQTGGGGCPGGQFSGIGGPPGQFVSSNVPSEQFLGNGPGGQFLSSGNDGPAGQFGGSSLAGQFGGGGVPVGRWDRGGGQPAQSGGGNQQFGGSCVPPTKLGGNNNGVNGQFGGDSSSLGQFGVGGPAGPFGGGVTAGQFCGGSTPGQFGVGGPPGQFGVGGPAPVFSVGNPGGQFGGSGLPGPFSCAGRPGQGCGGATPGCGSTCSRAAASDNPEDSQITARVRQRTKGCKKQVAYIVRIPPCCCDPEKGILLRHKFLFDKEDCEVDECNNKKGGSKNGKSKSNNMSFDVKGAASDEAPGTSDYEEDDNAGDD